MPWQKQSGRLHFILVIIAMLTIKIILDRSQVASKNYSRTTCRINPAKVINVPCTKNEQDRSATKRFCTKTVYQIVYSNGQYRFTNELTLWTAPKGVNSSLLQPPLIREETLFNLDNTTCYYDETNSSGVLFFEPNPELLKQLLYLTCVAFALFVSNCADLWTIRCCVPIHSE